jgi:hypothetical protein
MKLSLKHSSFAMAACVSLYALYKFIRQIPVVKDLAIWQSNIGYLPHVAVLVGMIILGIGLYQQREQLPRLNKSLRRQAIGIVTMVLGAVVNNCFFHGSILIGGMAYCYWESWLHIIVLLWVAVWLLQLGLTKHENTYANPVLGIVGIIVTVAAALLLTLMLVSYVRVLMTGHVAGFRTTIWLSWLRPIALIAIGGSILFDDRGIIKDKEQSDSEIKEVRSYSRASQVIAKVSVGAVLCSIIIGIIGGIFSWFNNNDFMGIYTISTFAFVHMLWIGSIIAMLLEKELARWHRMLNILAPIVINVVLVLWALFTVCLPSGLVDRLGRTMTDDIPVIGVILSLIFAITVWIINTVVVLRSSTRSKQEQISNQSDNL